MPPGTPEARPDPGPAIEPGRGPGFGPGSAIGLILGTGLVLLVALLSDPPDPVAPRSDFAQGDGDASKDDFVGGEPDGAVVENGLVDGEIPVGPASLIARFREFEAVLADAEAEARQPDAEPERPEVVRFRLERFVSQVGATAYELLDDPQSTPSQRQIAADAMLGALVRLAQVVPEVHDDVVEVADELDADPGNADLAPVTALYRVRGLCGDIAPEMLRQLSTSRFAALIEATTRLAGVEKPPPQAPSILFQVAAEAERRGLDREARVLFERHAERFPTDPAARYSPGRAHRQSARGEVLEEIAGAGPDGGTVKLGDLRGKIVLVDFWASWDGTTPAEASTLKALRDRLGPRGFEILGVNLDTDRAEADRAIAEASMDWPQVFAATGSASAWQTEPGLRFGVHELPFKLVVDREGRLIDSGEALGELVRTIEDGVLFPPGTITP